MTSSQIAPALILPFVAWRIYVRVRRNIGRQPWQPRRLVGRAVFFGLISALYATAVMSKPILMAALVGGMLLGLPLALWGLHLTEFVALPEGKFYTPNLWIGLALTGMFAGRIVYRMVGVMTSPAIGAESTPAFFSSPVTVAMFGVTAGYYVAYNVDVVRRGRKLLG